MSLIKAHLKKPLQKTALHLKETKDKVTHGIWICDFKEFTPKLLFCHQALSLGQEHILILKKTICSWVHSQVVGSSLVYHEGALNTYILSLFGKCVRWQIFFCFPKEVLFNLSCNIKVSTLSIRMYPLKKWPVL